jgi:hypothetical protein
MFENNMHRSKSRIEVEIYLNDGAYILGKMSVLKGERLSDLLNDDRDFLPIEMSNGTVVIVRKGHICKVVQLNQHVDTNKLTNPFEILNVPKNIGDTDLQQRYRQIIAENHPDKLTAAGMSVEFVQMANTRLARINDAYQRIVAMRQQQRAMTAAQQ